MQQKAPTKKAVKITAPPTAMPAIAPVDIFLEDVPAGDFVGVGITRVGDRDAIEACCVK